MFAGITEPMLAVMRRLEQRDAEERARGLPAAERICAVPPESGRFLALLAASAPDGALLEIGTSSGYSALWLSLAAKLRNQRVSCFELSPHKVALAKQTFADAQVEELVDLTEGDVRAHLSIRREIGFCFMDHDKSLYPDHYELVVANLVGGGIFAADNIVSHQTVLQPFVDHVLDDPRVDAVVVPIGKGILLARRV
jgi:predicted O-methyltransferase YrrM